MGKSDQNDVQKRTRDQLANIQQASQRNEAQLNTLFNQGQATTNYLQPGLTAGWGDIAVTGGFDPTHLDTSYRAFTNLAQGGIPEADAGAMRRQATAGVEGIYGGLAGQVARSASATGDMSGSLASRLARQGGEASARAITGVNAEIARQRAANTAVGAEGLTRTQQAVSEGRIRGLTGQTGIYGMNMEQTMNSVRGILQNYQVTGQLSNQDLGILQEISKRPGLFDNIIRGIGAGAGVISAISGIPGLGKKGGGGGSGIYDSSGSYVGE